MGKLLYRLEDVPAHLLSKLLVRRVYFDNLKAEAMNKDGSLKVESISSGEAHKIVRRLIDKAIKESEFLDYLGGARDMNEGG